MKRILLLLCAVLLGAFNANAAAPYTCKGTAFIYEGKSYDLREHGPINAVMSCKPAGRHIVIEGHVNPRNGIYLIFDTKTRSFVRELAGANLIWKGNDVQSCVYSFWADILDWDGNTVASVPLEGREYIRSLSFTTDGRLAVLIAGGAEDRTVFIPLRR
jgi:hypothetical protein